MPKEVGGKQFWTAEEAKELGIMPSEEEIARNQAILDQFDATIRAAGPAPEGTAPLGGRFDDDLVGTDHEGWTIDPATGGWRDQHGNPVEEQPNG